ncbi:hypothetical protein ACNOYE_38770 [Nannocystaceae bacterium ST9]
MADLLGMHGCLPIPAFPIPVFALTLACFEAPTLEEFTPPPPDLGTIDTWGPLGGLEPGAGAPGLDEGLTWAEGPSGLDGEGGEDPIADPADPALAQLRITEVLVDPPGKDGGPESPEFVELINPGPLPVDLGGLRIEAKSWPILDGLELGLEGVVLPVEGMLVIRRYADDVDASLAGVSVQGSLVFSAFLDDGGLRNGDGAIGLGSSASFDDVLVYGTLAESPFDLGWIGEGASTPDPSQALCRSPMSEDHDDASDWAPCEPSPGSIMGESDSGGSEGESGSGSESDSGSDTGEALDEPLPIAEAAVQIVEVQSNPPGPAAGEKSWEYVELLNVSENEVELEFARIGDDLGPDASGIDPLAHVSGEGGCASPTCLAPGRRALIVAQGYLGETGDALVLATDDSTIADGGLTNSEPLVLWDGFDALVTSYRIWLDPSGAPLPSDEQPLHRIDPLGVDEPANWTSAPATPGT